MAHTTDTDENIETRKPLSPGEEVDRGELCSI
jgi:hypothetical protein